jgi:periplasmic protein TonB
VIVQRLLLALFLALCFHGLFILTRLPGNTSTIPRLTGEETIRISLSPVVKAETTVDLPEKKPNRKQQRSGREPATSKATEPLKAMAKTPLRQELKDDPPVTLKTRAVKKIHHTPRNIKTTTNTPITHQIQIKEPAAPVSVKASPLYAKNPKPHYPALARRRNWQGTVLLAVFVSEKGEAHRVRLHKSSGHPLLDKSALKTVASWRFQPGMKSGHPVAMEVLVPIHFKLH